MSLGVRAANGRWKVRRDGYVLVNSVFVDVESAQKHLSALTTVAFTIRFRISGDKKDVVVETHKQVENEGKINVGKAAVQHCG